MTKIELFYANWCPHCVSFHDEWNKLEGMLKGTKIQAAKYEESENPQKMEEEGVKGYPTIKITTAGKSVEYKGDRTAEAIYSAVTGKTKSVQTAGEYKQCGGKRKGGFNRAQAKTKDEDHYKIKYMKYKAKYMKLRSNMRI